MRILIHCDNFAWAGGNETFVHLLCPTIRRLGHEVTLAVVDARRSPLLEDLRRQGIPLIESPVTRGTRWRLPQRFLVRRVLPLLGRFDILHCAKPPLDAFAERLVTAAHAAGVRVMFTLSLSPKLCPPSPRWRESVCRAVRGLDLLVSTAQVMGEEARAVYDYRGPLAVVPYLHVGHDAPLPLPPVDRGIRMAYAGRLDFEQKDLGNVLRAFAAARLSERDLEWHLYGLGPAERALRALAVELGVAEAVHFHGRYHHAHDAERVFGANHFMVYGSAYEGTPVALFETLSCGRFAVASRVGGIPDLYEGRPFAGTLVPPRDTAALTHAIASTAQRIRAGDIEPKAIHAYWRDEFAHEKIALKLRDAYEQCITGQRAAS